MFYQDRFRSVPSHYADIKVANLSMSGIGEKSICGSLSVFDSDSSLNFQKVFNGTVLELLFTATYKKACLNEFVVPRNGNVVKNMKVSLNVSISFVSDSVAKEHLQ